MALPSLSEIIVLLLGNLAGIPMPLLAGILFVAGLIVGYFIKKVLKLALTVLLFLMIGSYLGMVNLGSISDEVRSFILRYGVELLGILLGLTPLGLGFTIGLILGLLVG